MKTRELILISIIIGYLLAVFSFLVIEYEIKFQNYERKPIPMVELFGNGSTRNYEIENPAPDPNLFTSISISMVRFAFALPFVVAGIGIWGIPIAMIHGNFAMPPETPYHVLVFWMLSMISIPVTTIFSKGIPLWRRIPYIYLIAVLIGGTSILLNSDFGR